ncbi:MAG: hypothetical protein Q4C86_10775 [bacterium]|nr:hypothetical protein [bacterium]
MPELIANVIRTSDFGTGKGEDFIKDFFACPAWEENIISAFKKAGIIDEVFAIKLSVYTRDDAEADDDLRGLVEASYDKGGEL